MSTSVLADAIPFKQALTMSKFNCHKILAIFYASVKKINTISLKVLSAQSWCFLGQSVSVLNKPVVSFIFHSVLMGNSLLLSLEYLEFCNIST